jgi:hypothetical protein
MSEEEVLSLTNYYFYILNVINDDISLCVECVDGQVRFESHQKKKKKKEKKAYLMFEDGVQQIYFLF